jgi:hypothetical protein
MAGSAHTCLCEGSEMKVQMIDIDELERLANLATGDESICVHRDELLFLINRYRELPDETPEEAAELVRVPGVRPDAGEDPEKRSCKEQLLKAKRIIADNRHGYALFVDCPACQVKAGSHCRGTIHETRITAALAALRALRGSDYGEG